MGIVSLAWGASYLFIKVGLRDFSPPFIVFARVVLGAAILLPLALRAGALAPLRGRWRIIWFLAVVQMAGPFLLITWGEEEISSGLTGILVGSAPIFTALLASRGWADEPLGGWGALGVVVGIAGVVLLFASDLSGDAGQLFGGTLVLLAGIGYAVGGLTIKSRMGDVPPVGVASATMLASAAVTAIPALFAPPASAGLDSVAALVALGALGTGLAFLLFYTLLSEIGAPRASVVAYLASAFSVLYGVVLLGEGVTVFTIAGLVLILFGSYVAAQRRLPWSPRVSRTAPSHSTAPEPVRAR
jgi:drug/metabolite transporter (DMT)-like permease